MPAPDRRRLIVNADDLGLAASVNRGIIEAIESGVVTSSSLMVNMPAYGDALERLRASIARGLAASIGLHFNLTAGRPLTSCPTLVHPGSGDFLPTATLVWRAFARRISADDVQRELDAQLERAETQLASMGLCVTHIDSHRHSHCLPIVSDIVRQTAVRHGIAHVRHAYETPPLPRRPHAIVASRVLRAVVANHAPLDDVRFAGVGAMRSRTFEHDIVEVLSALPPGTTELMVHPGYDSPELAAIDSYRAPRERELRALTSITLRERIRELGVELTRFGSTGPAA